MMTGLLRAGGLLVLVLSALARGADDYTIKFDRPDKAGMKFNVVIACARKQENTVTINGKQQPTKDQVIAVQMEAKAEVLEADDRGRDRKVAYTIDKCYKVVDDKEVELLPKGRVLTARLDGTETALEVNEGKLSDEQISDLKLVVQLDSPEEPGMDDLYGTTDRQKIGGTWKVGTTAAVKIAEMAGIVVRKEDISGSAKLNKTESVDGIEWLNISGEMVLKNGILKPLDAVDVPPGITVKEVSIDHKFSGQIPTDTSLNRMNTSSTFSRTIVSEGQVKNRDYRQQSKATYVYESRVAEINE
jgi:hypothetical protein